MLAVEELLEQSVAYKLISNSIENTGRNPDISKGFDKLMEMWRTNKADLIDMFGGERIEINLKDDYCESSAEEVVGEAANSGIFNDTTGDSELYSILYNWMREVCNKHGKWIQLKILLHFSGEELISNKILYLHNDPVAITKREIGTKFLKWLQAHKDNYDLTPREYDIFMSEYTKFLPTLKGIRGKLVLSVNPVDILTAGMSGIESCHNIIRGMSRTGPVAFMCDNVTAIAYFYRTIAPYPVHVGAKNVEYQLPRKIWRQMVFIHPKKFAAVFGRNFPTENVRLEKATRKLVGNLLCKRHGIETPKWYAHLADNGMLKRGSSRFYFDPSRTTITSIPLARKDEFPKITAGKDPICPSCGERYLDNNGRLICDYCFTKETCQGCGKEGVGIIRHITVRYPNGRTVRFAACQECIDERFAYCADCRSYVPKNHTIQLHGKTVCNRCIEQYYDTCPVCGEYSRNVFSSRDGKVKMCKECVDKSEKYTVCRYCGRIEEKSNVIDAGSGPLDGYKTHYYNGRGTYCRQCFDEIFVRCEDCGGIIHRGYIRHIQAISGGKLICPNCYKNYRRCYSCGSIDVADNFTRASTGNHYCKECAERLLRTCASCGDKIPYNQSRRLGKIFYCRDCYHNALKEELQAMNSIREETA